MFHGCHVIHINSFEVTFHDASENTSFIQFFPSSIMALESSISKDNQILSLDQWIPQINRYT